MAHHVATDGFLTTTDASSCGSTNRSWPLLFNVYKGWESLMIVSVFVVSKKKSSSKSVHWKGTFETTQEIEYPCRCASHDTAPT
eukprot:m.766929 g.766929  ORF g.766929 m.766929 type:complete len:84 (+) comp23225_c0_seq18:996-1247(+)